MIEATPLILSFNEAPNLPRTLRQLRWAGQIVVLDSFSTDETESICRGFPNLQFVQRRFDDHTSQWNYGLDLVPTPWVLSLDADYVLTDPLVHELQGLRPDPGVMAYFARFTYCIHGHPLRSALYPPRAVLFRKDACRYVPDGHTQLLRVSGRTAWLRNQICHDDRKPLDRWLASQLRYSALEAAHLAQTPPSQLNSADRIRRTILLAPFLVFFHTLFAKRLILDGWPGWYYVFQRTLVELLRSLRLLDLRFAPPKDSTEPR